jgi:hypothetical protein
MESLTTGHLVVKRGETAAATFSDETELAFLLDPYRPKQAFLRGLGQSFADELAQAVLRAPRDLSCHTRRIFHAYEQADGETLYGAMLDLFLTLGRHGRTLRAHLLAGVESRLAPGQVASLRRWLDEGKRPPTLAIGAASVLSDGVEGDVALVKAEEWTGVSR